MNCQLKRACCLDCIEKHSVHKQDLKTIKQITQWKKNTTQSHQIYLKKMGQIVEIMGQAEKYLSKFGEVLEKSFEEIMNEEFEKQVCNLLRIQQLSQPFDQLISNLETLMEPISQIFQIFEASSKDIYVKTESSLNKSHIKSQTIGSDQQIQKEKNIDLEVKQKTKRMKTYSYLDQIEKTSKIRTENGFDIHQYPRYCKSSFGSLEEYKTIILIGTQSSQKQNLINLFVNFYYGVEFSDPYRFEIADDIDITKEKQNDEYQQMKVYYIPPQNGISGLRIIYTMDYSDDLSYDDQKKFERIFDVIKNSVSLNQNILICFVIPQQVQIGSFFMLESILCKFSNLLIKNIVFLFPDCTDDYPKQKYILQSQTEMINGIPSPVFKMIPTMHNFWYLKFNTQVLFIENKTQENQFLWEMGKNSFQFLFQNYLQNKFNTKSLYEMKNKYDEFFNNLSFKDIIQKFKYKFLELYNRENFFLSTSFEQDIEIITKEMAECIDFQSRQQLNKEKPYHCTYKIKNQQQIEKKMTDYFKYVETCTPQIECFLSIIEDEKIYNEGFEEFYDMFKNFGNFRPLEYTSWRLYFNLNSILISINPCQWRYYDHLNTKEHSLKQQGWEERVKLLTKTSKLFNYFDDSTKIPNLDQLIKEWSDQHFTKKYQYIRKYEWQEYSIINDIINIQQIEKFQFFYQLLQNRVFLCLLEIFINIKESETTIKHNQKLLVNIYFSMKRYRFRKEY